MTSGFVVVFSLLLGPTADAVHASTLPLCSSDVPVTRGVIARWTSSYASQLEMSSLLASNASVTRSNVAIFGKRAFSCVGCSVLVASRAIQVFLEDQAFVEFDLTGSSMQRVIELAFSGW